MKISLIRTLSFTIVILLSPAVRAQDVSVQTSYPAGCNSGQNCTVEITLHKQGIEGFARFQQMLPEGFTAQVLQDAGSDFIFDKQKVSFIWLSLPAIPSVTVSYTITLDPALSGIYEIGEGTFSYLRDNRIQKHLVAPSSVMVNPKEAVAVAVREKEDPVIDPKTPDTVMVEYEAEPVMELPAGQEAEVAEVKEPEVPARVTIPEEKKPVVQAKGENPVAEVPKKTLEPAEQLPPVVVVQEPVALPEKKEPEPVKEPQTVRKDEIPAVEAKEQKKPMDAGMVYRIQFAALQTFKEADLVKKQFGVKGEVYHEFNDPWHRYTFGNWQRRQDAEAASRDYNALTGKKSYVICYMNGERVPCTR